MPVLELNDISYCYPQADTNAVENFSATLKTGSITTLLGANGSGKSTIGKIAAGLIQPSRGSVNISEPVLTSSWNSIGVLFQSPDDQFVSSTVGAELAYGLENLALETAVINQAVEECLDRYKLKPLRDRSPEQLSDGQKQLVALMSVMLMRPRFLILDEAVSYLDWGWQEIIRRTIEEVVADTGVLWITTRTSEALRADEVWLIDDGKLIASGEPSSTLSALKLEQYGLAPL